MGGLNIQIMSDLHLEMSGFQRTPTFPVSAPYLALLGDIGVPGTEKYSNFIAEVSAKYTTVFLVAGNHEFYGGEYEKTKEEIRKLADLHPNVYFLDRKAVEVQGIKILGCTLWSTVPEGCERIVENSINDYRMIGTGDDCGNMRAITVADTNAMHQVERDFLRQELERSKEAGQPTLILTHHAPLSTGTSHPRYYGLPTSHAFSTDLEDLMGLPLVAWVHGHTHFNSAGQYRKGTFVVANQMGYSREDTGAAFDAQCVLRVEESNAFLSRIE